MGQVKVYGADWCEDTKGTREFLEKLGVDYDYVNIEENEQAADWVKRQNDGRERKPTVKIGEHVLSVPSDEELEGALRAQNLLS
ncbi:MAG TPA: glutaredoxin family protein [Pyrinomonadaceae bacterium]